MEDTPHRSSWIGATAAVVAIAVAVRFSINFASTYPPGVDAAYYPLQTYSWLTRGRLMYDDLPLIFWMNAGLSKVLAATGRPLADAALAASRVLDSIVEPFAAVGVMALAYAWARGRLSALPGCLAAGMLVVLSPPIMRMLSDFEKNSLGLVFMAFAVWACRQAIDDGRGRSWIVLIAVMSLAALTHAGTFAITMATVMVALAVWAVLSISASKRWTSIVMVAAGAGLLLGLLAFFDPRRALGLLRAPAAFLTAGPIEHVEPAVIAIAVALVGIALRLAWRDRRELGHADTGIVVALSVTLIVLLSPKSYVYFNRLLLMVPVPAAMLLTFVFARSRRAAPWAGAGLVVAAIFAAFTAPGAVQPSLMDQETADELSAIKTHIADPESTLVIAPHGLEWWAGHLLGTPVRSTVPDEAPARYQRVLLLRNTTECRSRAMSPFAAPPVGTLRQIYAGQCLELFQSK